MANYNEYLEYLKHIDNTTEQEIKTKIDGLNDEISNLKTSLSNLNKVKDDLTTDLANAKKQISDKVDLINLKETELKKVSNDLANVQKNLKDTNFKLTEVEKLHNIEQKKNSTISNELAEVKSKYYILESEVKNKNKTVNDYITEIQKLHLDLENVKNDFKNASSSNTSTTEQINKYRSEIDNLNKTIDDLKKNNNTAELTDLKIKLDKKESELNTLAKNKSLLDSELKTEKERNKNLNDSVIQKIEELKNLEPKNNLKYIFGSLAGVFLITSIILFSMYQSSERDADYQFSEYSRVSNELDKKNAALNDIKLSMAQIGKFIIIKDARFKTNTGTGLTFNSSQLRRISPIIEIYSYLDKDTVVNIKYDRKEPNGSWTNFSGEGYYVNEKFTINPGNNELEFNGFWGNDDEWSKGTGDFNYTFYSDNLLKNYSKKLFVK